MTYTTVREAAIAGTRAAIERARDTRHEWGGVILASGDRYVVSDLVTNKNEHEVSLFNAYPSDLREKFDLLTTLSHGISSQNIDAIQSFADRLEEEFRRRVVGTFHVHITESRDNARYFSGRDIALAIKLRTRTYLGHTDSGKVFELDGRSKEKYESTQGEIKTFSEIYEPFQALVMLEMASEDETIVPWLARGTEIFTGDR